MYPRFKFKLVFLFFYRNCQICQNGELLYEIYTFFETAINVIPAKGIKNTANVG